MHKIAVFSTKGGVDKSAITVFLADFLSTAFGKRILVVDLDPQHSSAVALLGDERVYGSFDQGKSLPALLTRVMRAEVTADDVRGTIIPRQEIKGRGKHAFLKTLDVLACDRERWHNLNDDLAARRDNARSYYDLVNDALRPVCTAYDVCLIDFPAHDVGPIVRAGLRASDWWLFPITPDRPGTRDVSGPIEVIHEVGKYNGHPMKGLGTLLNIAQNRSGNEYRLSKRSLQQLAEQQAIPPLFAAESEIGFSTDAKNALDDTFLDKYRTLTKRYGANTKPLYKSMRSLSKEVLRRMAVPYKQADSIRFLERVNEVLTGFWK